MFAGRGSNRSKAGTYRRQAGATILKRILFFWGTAICCLSLVACSGSDSPGDPNFTLTAWNDLGMHCIDHDYSVFAILPPYNNLRAQLVNDASGAPVTTVTTGVTITYEAVGDPSGSINTTSWQKTSFWDWVPTIFGVNPANDVGLAGNPVQSLTPAQMTFDIANGYWKADGIPAVSYDNAGKTNYYPMVKVVARDAAGNVLAVTRTVLPVSDEMTCRQCHTSNTGDPAAQPIAGWVNDPNPEKDWKRNILALHDDRNLGKALYTDALAAKGFEAAGLLVTSDDGRPMLCASCHPSNALGTAGVAGINQLTISMHSWHGTHAMDDATGLPLGESTSRTACYLCHPGSTTQCLRGVMGNARTPAGDLLLQCQSCHGTVSTVGTAGRRGWLDLPTCDGCHYRSDVTGSYVRDVSAFTASGVWRTPGGLFGTNSQLFKLAKTHGMQCEACHGSTHAEYPSSEVNDNVQSILLQGYAGKITECSVCHAGTPLTNNGGPHGLHTLGQTWVNAHGARVVANVDPCRTCHANDYRGMFLSKTSTARTFTVRGSAKSFAAGTMIGCYDCHNGPNGLF